ncbi:hypothetical protein K9B32_22860 [Rhizobium sp. 3T7]|uniref:hypothetical protein n=1 Tax=Rhizobium sp. 3T7 TaxID=2874922 RepID=UPI001CCDF451|nr:hypothetical protein [Rhizobium sp. 3T7]MBZ9792913.1 hypothetical protein [Rhizobium sp. 3T7]
MAHSETYAVIGGPEKRLLEPYISVGIIAFLRRWRRSVARRKALADLTIDQLRDIGHPDADRPRFEIDARLAAKLMSMR